MKEVFNFLVNIGKLKGRERRGWVFHKIKNAETTAEHSFHIAFLVWVIGKKKKNIDMERAIKMALAHDICEVYSPDFTSYDAVAIDENKEITKENFKELRPKKGRPIFKQRAKMEKIKKELEEEGMGELLKSLDKELKEELYDIWKEYEVGETLESRLVRQADKVINLFQGMEYHKKQKDIEYDLWIQRAKETIDDPHLLELLKEIEEDIEI